MALPISLAVKYSGGRGCFRSYTEQTPANIPRFSVVGHTTEALRILAADIVSEPYNGTAYAGGENIEVRIFLSGPVRVLTTPLTVPLHLGEGAENRRETRLGTIVADKSTFRYWRRRCSEDVDRPTDIDYCT